MSKYVYVFLYLFSILFPAVHVCVDVLLNYSYKLWLKIVFVHPVMSELNELTVLCLEESNLSIVLWKEKIEDFLLETDSENKSDENKISIFLDLANTEAKELLKNF